MKIELDLTKDEVETLGETVDRATDEGPYDEGWCSKTLESLQRKVEAAIRQATND